MEGGRRGFTHTRTHARTHTHSQSIAPSPLPFSHDVIIMRWLDGWCIANCCMSRKRGRGKEGGWKGRCGFNALSPSPPSHTLPLILQSQEQSMRKGETLILSSPSAYHTHTLVEDILSPLHHDVCDWSVSMVRERWGNIPEVHPLYAHTIHNVWKKIVVVHHRHLSATIPRPKAPPLPLSFPSLLLLSLPPHGTMNIVFMIGSGMS